MKHFLSWKEIEVRKKVLFGSKILIWPCSTILRKGERSSEFYETLFELEGVRNEEKGAFLEQNISLALLYNIKAISETS